MFAFLQRRRLLRAIELMHEDKFTLTEIALECGFDSGSSLSRIFRKQFQCSPSQYREQRPLLLLPPARPRVNHTELAEVEIRETHVRQAVMVECRGINGQSFEQAATAAFRILVSEIKRANIWPAMRQRIGICPDEASMVPDAEARYQAGFIYEGQLPAMGDAVRRVAIPGGRWVVSLHQGSYETVWQSWNRMYRDWLPSSGYATRDAAPFDLYLNDQKTVPPEELRTEIWIPIE